MFNTHEGDGEWKRPRRKRKSDKNLRPCPFTGKMTFRKLSSANAMAARVSKVNSRRKTKPEYLNRQLETYECHFCGKIHIARKRLSKRLREKEQSE